MTKVKIIGVGNRFRSDDALGPILTDRLRALLPERVHVEEASGEGTVLMDAWRGADRVVILDAVRSGAAPGTIFRLDALVNPIPTRFFHYSTHAFSVAEAIEVSRALDELPPGLVVYGIEGKTYEAGEGLSDEVARAAEEVVRQVVAEVNAYLEAEARHA